MNDDRSAVSLGEHSSSSQSLEPPETSVQAVAFGPSQASEQLLSGTRDAAVHAQNEHVLGGLRRTVGRFGQVSHGVKMGLDMDS